MPIENLQFGNFVFSEQFYRENLNQPSKKRAQVKQDGVLKFRSVILQQYQHL